MGCFRGVSGIAWDGRNAHHLFLWHLLQTGVVGLFYKDKVPVSGLCVTVENAEHSLSLLEGNDPKKALPVLWALGRWPVPLSFKGALTATFSTEALSSIPPRRCQNGDKGWIPLVSAAGPDSVNGKNICSALGLSSAQGFGDNIVKMMLQINTIYQTEAQTVGFSAARCS